MESLGRPGIGDSIQEGTRGCNPINNCQQKGMMLRKVNNKRQIRVESSRISRGEKKAVETCGEGCEVSWIELWTSCPPKGKMLGKANTSSLSRRGRLVV